MNYNTEDAIRVWKQVQSDIQAHGPQVAYDNLSEGHDPELLALTLTLAVSSTYPLPR